MSDRNDTSKWKQLAEWAAVVIIGMDHVVSSPEIPIRWIEQRKIIRGAKNSNGPAIRFLFGVDVGNKDFPLLTAVEVSLKQEGNDWKLFVADLERNWYPGRPNREVGYFHQTVRHEKRDRLSG